MKILSIPIILFFVSNQIIGQNNNQLNRFINSSISAYIANDQNLVRQGYSLRDTNHYYICMDGLPATFPCDSVKNVTFFSLHNLNGLPKSFRKQLQKGVRACFVWMELTEKQFSIHIGRRNVRLGKNKNIEIEVGDWGIFTYKYSCETQEWKFDNVKYGGV